MTIKKKAWLMALILGSMALAACGGRSESKSSSQQQSQSSTSASESTPGSSEVALGSENITSNNDKYIIGRRVFDNDYNNYPNPKATLKIDEFPNLEFSYNQLDSSYYLEGLGIAFNYCCSFYIADVNQDGYSDICYSYVKGSGIVNYGIAIYDIQNNTVLLEKEDRGEFDYLFDLDDNGCLLIEELEFNDHRSHLLNKALRFIKNQKNELLFEEFSFESKLKGFLCGLGSGDRNQYKVSILLVHVGINDRYALNANEIIVEGIVDFTYSVDKYEELVEGSPDFNLFLKFGSTITTNITISIKDIKQTIRVSVS